MWRDRRLLRRGALTAGVLGFAGLLLGAWALAWPMPASTLACTQEHAEPCAAVAGRVVWIPRKDLQDRTRALHLLLASRDSEAAPGVSLIKIPPEMRPAQNPSFGRWVSAVGTVQRGSRGFDDVHVSQIRWSE